MSRDVSDGRQTEIGDAGSPVLVDQNVRLRRWLRCKCGDISFGKQERHSFQIPVDYADSEVMRVLQTIGKTGQLNGSVSMAPAGVK